MRKVILVHMKVQWRSLKIEVNKLCWARRQDNGGSSKDARRRSFERKVNKKAHQHFLTQWAFARTSSNRKIIFRKKYTTL